MKMKRNPMDEAIAALQIAPVQTVLMSASAVIAVVLYGMDSRWFTIPLLIALISGCLVWRATPAMIQAANKRAKARHRYPY